MSTNPTTSSPQPPIIILDELAACSSLKKPAGSVRPTPKELIDQGIAAMFDGSVVEVRIPKAGRLGTISGYFDDYSKLSAAIEERSGKQDIKGIYYCLNPVNPDLLARASNRLVERADFTTSDKDILRRRWLPIDIDPIRPAGISSTDDEKQLASEKIRAVRTHLIESGWPEPLVADSGNGYHLLYRIDLPNDDGATRLVQDCLNALSEQFSDTGKGVKVDTTLFNAARIVKAYGSLAAKGDHTTDRPHRLAKILPTETPGGGEVVPTEKLKALAGLVRKPAPVLRDASGNSYSGPKIAPEQVENMLDLYVIGHRERVRETNGFKWTLLECPFNPEHQNKDAAVFLTDEGILGFKCFHDHCASYHWHEFRAELQKKHPTKSFSFGKHVAEGEKDLTPFFSDRGLAKRWATLRKDYVRYLDRGLWIVWRDGLWVEDTAKVLALEDIGQFLEETVAEVDRRMPDAETHVKATARKRLCSAACQSSVAIAARQRPAIFLPADELDKNVWLLGLPGGKTVDLRSGETRSAEPHDFISKRTSVAPSDAECPLWRKFLKEITGDDNELELYLQRLAGYWLTGDVREENLTVFYGGGGNGKGTFVGALTDILGVYATAIPLSTLLTKKHGEEDLNAVALLCGSRVGVADEGAKSRRMDTTMLKTLTGGNKLVGKRLFENKFEFRPTHKMVILTNFKPKLDIDGAIKRRLHLVPFLQTFTGARQDKNLKEKLVNEYPAILSWAIQGCLDWQKLGLAAPKAVVDFTQEYLHEFDNVQQWIDSSCVREKDWFEPNSRLFDSWSSYCRRTNTYTGDMKEFLQDLSNHGFERGRTKAERGIKGLRIQPSTVSVGQAVESGDYESNGINMERIPF
jgi:P4 family phage/plasmid primase-like protien